MTTSGGTRTSFSALRALSSAADVGRAAAEGLIALLFPPHCIRCGGTLARLGVLCPTCEAELPELSGPRCRRCGEALARPDVDLCMRCGTQRRAVDRFASLGPYSGPWGELVRALKFDGERVVGRYLSARMAQRVRASDLVDAFDLITFVPMWPADRRERGFNQAQVLAAGLGRRLQRPVRRLLAKRRWTPPQGRLHAAARRENLRGAFELLRYGKERVLLVDDIGTTASTVEACAGVLRQGGYASVSVLTVARA